MRTKERTVGCSSDGLETNNVNRAIGNGDIIVNPALRPSYTILSANEVYHSWRRLRGCVPVPKQAMSARRALAIANSKGAICNQHGRLKSQGERLHMLNEKGKNRTQCGDSAWITLYWHSMSLAECRASVWDV